MAIVQTYEAVHLSGAGTTVVLTGPGVLHSIVVGTAGTTVTVYDNTASSGQVISVIGAVTGTFTFDIQLKIGLTIVIVGAADVTVETT